MTNRKYQSVTVILLVFLALLMMTSACRNDGSASAADETAISTAPSSVEIEPAKTATEKEIPFTDVPANKWFYNAVCYCYENGYMNGTSKDKFTPTGQVTRATFVTVLYKIDCSSDIYTECQFEDVAPGMWYTCATEWAYRSGYASGTGNNCFSPNAPVTRETIVTFLYKYSLLKGYDVSASANLSSYIDLNELDAWADSAMRWAVAKNLISGTSNNKLSPRLETTRAMASVMIQGYMKLLTDAPVDTAVSVKPDTYDAVDSLGRVLSSSESVPEKRDDKFVGVFYWTWHENSCAADTPRVAGDIVKQFPDAVNDYSHTAWENTAEGTRYFWGTPLYGFYSTCDEWVLRKHAEMLADAGVDVIIFDCTNGTFMWEDSAFKLMRIFEEAREDGVNTPQIAYMLNFAANSAAKQELITLYDKIYSKGRYRDLWFYWEGKPLIMAWPDALDTYEPVISSSKRDDIMSFFTFRKNNASYFTSTRKYTSQTWGWMSVYPQTVYGKRNDGTVEQMCVSVAQNATDNALVAMNSGDGVHGRSHSEIGYEYYYNRYGKEKIKVDGDIEDSEKYGINFQEQWDYALGIDPDFIFVTGWNEWVAGRHQTWQGTENAFPDQFSEEYSRDIEPEDGILKDNYYMQLCENIRRYKGVSVEKTTAVKKSIDISLGTADWEDIEFSYDDYIDYTKARNGTGYGGTKYTEEAVRNDIIHSKFAYDDENLYFMVQTSKDLTSSNCDKWMRLFITLGDYDEDSWEGMEYIVNRTSPKSGKTNIEKLSSDFSAEKTGEASYTVNGNTLVVSIPRASLGIEDGTLPVIRFKWCDNAVEEENGDIMDVYKSGDSAPNGRFMYRVEPVTE